MTVRSYLWGIAVGTLLSFSGWAAVLVAVDPETWGMSGAALFYATLLLGCSGSGILLFTWLYGKSALQAKAPFAYLAVSLRQGILAALLLVVLLMLQDARLLTWWDALLVAAAILLIELHFLTRK